MYDTVGGTKWNSVPDDEEKLHSVQRNFELDSIWEGSTLSFSLAFDLKFSFLWPELRVCQSWDQELFQTLKLTQ